MNKTTQPNTATRFNVWAKYGTDINLEDNGAKFVLDDEGKVYILVARNNGRNVQYNREIAELSNRYDDLDDPQANEEFVEITVKHLVKGWQGITDKKGNELPFTIENAIDLLHNLRDLYVELFNFSMKRENYALDLLEENTKNS